MTPEDICAHHGDDYHSQLGAVSPPIYQTSLFSRKSGGSGFSYTRTNNPTIELAEKKIAALEGAGAARCFASGMAAISAVVTHLVSAGSHVIAPKSVYLPVRSFLESYLTKFGVEVTFVDATNLKEIESAIRPETALIYLESPVSNVFALQDLDGVARIAAKRGIKSVVDNSWSTPVFQNPHKFGIDYVVHSASKYLGGHSDLVAGVATGTEEQMQEIRHTERGFFGASMDPHAAWLLIRSLRTLPIRMRAHEASAIAIARFLESHSAVKRVYYPGLDSHPQRDLAERQMYGTSGVMSFTTNGNVEQVKKAIASLGHFEIGPSWGGYESILNTPGLGIDRQRSEETGIPPGLIRISIGLEHTDTLLDDLDRALALL